MATQTYEFTTPGTHTFLFPANATNVSFILRGAKGGNALGGTYVDPRQPLTASPPATAPQGQYMTGSLDPGVVGGQTITVYLGDNGNVATSNFGFDAGAAGGSGYYSGGSGGQAPGAETWVTAGGGSGGGGASALVAVDLGTVLAVAGGSGGCGGSAVDYGGQVPAYRTTLTTNFANAGNGQNGGNGSTSANGGSGGGGGGVPKGNGGGAQFAGNHIPGAAGQGGGGYYNDLAVPTCAITDEPNIPDARDDGYFYISFDSGDPPTVQFESNPAVIIQGEGSTTLSWQVTAAPGDEPTSITLNGAAIPAAGTQVVAPTTSTDYTITAIGPGGTTTDTIRVVVIVREDPGDTVITTTYNVISVHRYYNATTGDHFCDEAGSPPNAVTYPGYVDQGEICKAFSVATGQPPLTVPLVDNDDADALGGPKPYSGVIGYVYPNLVNGLTAAQLATLPVGVKTIYGWTNGADTMWSVVSTGEWIYTTNALFTDPNGIIFYAPISGYSFDTIIPNPQTTFTYGVGNHTLSIPAGSENAFLTIAAGRGGSGGSDAGGGGCGGAGGRVQVLEILPPANNLTVSLQIGGQGSNGASGSPGNKPGGSGGSGGAAGGGAGGRDSQGGGWSGSGGGGGAASGASLGGTWIAVSGGGGGGGGGSWERSCTNGASAGGGTGVSAAINPATGGAGANCGGDGGGGGGGGGGAGAGGGGGAGVDKSFGGSSGSGGGSQYDPNYFAFSSQSTNNNNGYGILSFTIPPSISYFRANDDSPTTTIQEGDPVVLSWSTLFNGNETASTAEIDQGIGTVQVGNQFLTILSPMVTTTYTLTVASGGAFSQAEVTVEVEAPDDVADVFGFDSVENAELTTMYESNVVTLSGLDIPVTAFCTNGAELSHNGGAYTSDSITGVVSGDTLQVRMESSNLYATAKTSSIAVGVTNGTFTITTKVQPANIPNTFAFEDVVDAPLESYVLSNEVTITGLNVVGNVGIPLNGAESSVNDGEWSTAGKLIDNGDGLRLRVLTSDVLGDAINTGVQVGTGPLVPWNVTNVTVADDNPDFFDFVDKIDQPANTFVESDILNITGINVPTNVIVTPPGQLRVDGGVWDTVGSIGPNGTLQLRLQSSTEPGGEVSTTVSVGNSPLTQLSDDWKVVTTTAGDIIPDAFTFINKDNQPPNTLIYSNVVQIFGITSPSPIAITGGEMQINGGLWVTAGSINNGETLRLRIQSSASLGTSVAISITVG
jgi:hypothetical protein